MAMARPPVTALPSMIAGMTRSGSAAANGIAPSVMNDSAQSPGGLAVLAFGDAEQSGTQDRREGQGQRWHHAGQHHGGHHLELGGAVGAAVAAAPRPATAKE